MSLAEFANCELEIQTRESEQLGVSEIGLDFVDLALRPHTHTMWQEPRWRLLLSGSARRRLRKVRPRPAGLPLLRVSSLRRHRSGLQILIDSGIEVDRMLHGRSRRLDDWRWQ